MYTIHIIREEGKKRTFGKVDKIEGRGSMSGRFSNILVDVSAN